VSQLKLTLPDGSVMEVAQGTTALAAAEQIGRRLAKAAVAARLNGQLLDLGAELTEEGSFELLTFDAPEGKAVYWHSSAHVMAAAVLRLFPEAKPTIGPPIDEGFYYDFDVAEPFTEEDLAAIEAEMAKLIEADDPFERTEMSAEEAIEHFREQANPYKVELIEEIAAAGDETVSLYKSGEFVDLCRGPHLPSTGRIGAFKLLSVAGAYWRGDERNQMLQRIYGVSYPDKKLLDAYLEFLEQARLRDHRRLGRELELFTFFEEAGAGQVYYHPYGAMLRQLVCDFTTKEHLRRGYKLLRTPHLVKADIWDLSGHRPQGYPMYYTEVDGQEYGVKPMNCPGHILIYKSKTRSYRDLPLRYFELGTVYRHELAGVLHGLMRVRGFTQDDAHIFCTPEQLEGEIIGVVDFAIDMMHTFDFDEYKLYLSTRPERSVGTDEQWELATKALIQALERKGLGYEVDEGGGAFYGPKIDINVRDAIGRFWQCPTIQCDFTLPERFDIEYIGPDGKPHRPVMIHRVVLAGIERFLGVLIENYAGNFPVWLAPVQVRVLPITDRNQEYAEAVHQKLFDEDFRVELDDSNQTLSAKIRDGELMKIPYLLIVGDKEQEAEAVAVRHRHEGDLGPQPLEEFIARLKEEDVPGR